MRLRILTAAMLLLFADLCHAARLTLHAQQEFENYTAAVERRLSHQQASPNTYVAALNLGAAERVDATRQLRSGSLLVEPVNGGMRDLDGALLHHWRGTALVPNGKAKDMLALLRDYNRLATYYAPEVESSHLLSNQPGITSVAMRMREQKIITVVLDGEYEIHSELTGVRGHSSSRSTHIWQISKAGTKGEHRLPEGNDDGFLWRLNSYWSFLEVPDGLLIECEAVSLTRDVPAGLGGLITPVIEHLSRESLIFTLNATRNALQSAFLKQPQQ